MGDLVLLFGRPPFHRPPATVPVPPPPPPSRPPPAPSPYPERDELLALLCKLPMEARMAVALQHAGWTLGEIAIMREIVKGRVAGLVADGNRQMRHDWYAEGTSGSTSGSEEEEA